MFRSPRVRSNAAYRNRSKVSAWLNDLNSAGKFGQFLGRGIFRGPGQIHAVLCVARKHMKMEMRYRLPPGFAVGLKNRHPSGIEFLLHRFGDSADDLKNTGGLIIIQIHYRFAMGFQGDNDVARIHLSHVHERDMPLIFKHFVAGYFTRCDFTENTIRHFFLLSNTRKGNTGLTGFQGEWGN
jgi:hypothetical protein